MSSAKPDRVEDQFTEGPWQGQRAFIVGGGPSLIGFDFAPLQGERVIAVNKAHRCGVADLILTGDRRWLLRRAPHENIAPDLPIVYARRMPQREPMPAALAGRIFIIACCETRAWGRSFRQGVAPGCSGIRAANFAALLGADPIYLLGFDLGGAEAPILHPGPPKTAGRGAVLAAHPRRAHREHWHGGYGYPPARRYDAFIEHWQAAVASGDMAARVVNLNPQSRLRCLPFARPEDVL